MKHFLDRQLKGHALIFDGPLDLVKHARDANQGPSPFKKVKDVNWPGRKGNTWDDLERFLHSPWPEAVNMVRRVAEGIRQSDLPEPKDVRRKPRWSEDDGDVDVDRVMYGEPEYMRTTKRQRVQGSMTVSIISNLDSTKSVRCNPSGVFFRSACSIALADILNDLGYTVEIWTWTRGSGVYPKPYDKQFIACRPLAAGQPVDVDAMCDTMSHWFTTQATFGAFAACPDTKPEGFGYAVEPDTTTTEFEKCGMGEWKKYLDLDQGTFPVCVPMIYGSMWGADRLADGISNAVTQARRVLDAIVAAQG